MDIRKTSLLVLLTTLCFHFYGISQPVLAPLLENPVLKQTDYFGAASNTQTERIYILAGRTEEICLPQSLAKNGIDTVINIECSTLEKSEVLELDSCMVIRGLDVSELTVDTLCLLITDGDGREFPLTVYIHITNALELPFIDDFSYNGVYPSAELWQSRDVFINSSLAYRPPSVGVATFDGLDEMGAPHGGGYGDSDIMTSNYIDLSTSQSQSFYLYFWIQARGKGFDGFPAEKDSFYLQLKTLQGDWVTYEAIPGIGDNPVSEFTPYEIEIPASFKSDEFQFRFINKSSRDGIISLWHLDYVFLYDEKQFTNNIQDMAFSEYPPFIIKPYTSMPYVHFRNNEEKYLIDSIDIYIQNNYNSTQPSANQDSIVLKEIMTGTELIPYETLLEPISGQRSLEPGYHHFQNSIKTQSDMIANAKSINLDDEVELQFELKNSFQSQGDPVQLRSNNDLTRTTEMKNYFAYDDGVAEAGIYIPAGTSFPVVVQEFEFEVDDTIKGMQVHYPHIYKGADRQRHRLVMWIGELTEDPDYSRIYDGPTYVDDFDDNSQAFTSFAFKNSEDQDTSYFVPKGKVYIGWQQISGNTNVGLYLGFDRNNDQSDKIWYRLGTTWNNLRENDDRIKGNIMIRPVVGDAPVPTTKLNEQFVGKMSVFPNPTYDKIFIEIEENFKQSKVIIIDVYGNKLIDQAFSEHLDVSMLSAGMYFINIIGETGKLSARSKFIKL